MGLSERAATTLRRGSVTAVLVIAFCAATLSYSGLHDLAIHHGVSHNLAWLVPVMIDGMQVAGSLSVIYANLSGMPSGYSWFITVIGVLASVIGNWKAAPRDLTAELLHSTPSIVLALALEALMRVYRHKVHIQQQQALAALTATASDSILPAITAQPAPAIRPATPATTPVAPPAPTPAAPATRTAPTEPAATKAPAAPPKTETAPTTAPAARTTPAKAPAKKVTPAVPAGNTTREQLKNLLAENPDVTATDAANLLRRDRSNVSKLLRELRAEATNTAPATQRPTAPISPLPTAAPAPTASAPRHQAPTTAPTPAPAAAPSLAASFGTPVPPAARNADAVDVKAAKNELFTALNFDSETAKSIWERLGLPNEGTVTRAQADSALNAARAHNAAPVSAAS